MKMAKKKKSTVPVTLGGQIQNGTLTANSNWYITSASAGTFTITPSYNILQGIHDLRCHLFKVDIGEYDSQRVTALLRGIEFQDERIVISFLLDDKDTIREAFNEYHYFRLSYLDTKGNPVETYEIKTDPIAETKYILPNVRHDLSDIPNWKLIWSPYNVTKI
jgi:hypothetical protein